MLYLFNSGHRPLYVKNVLNTLFIPAGGTNEYRYRYHKGPGTTGAINISPTSMGELRSIKRDTPTVLIFVDRFNEGGYSYHPLRKARFVSTRKSNEYIFFRLKLEDFIYPHDNDGFNQSIRKYLHPKGVPKLTDDDPQNTSDGFYAVLSDDIFAHEDDFQTGTNAWARCVEQLQDCQAFSSGLETHRQEGCNSRAKRREFVFMRCELHRSTGKSISPSLINGEAVFDLVKGELCELDLAYVYPSQRTDTTSTAIVSCILGDSLKSISPSKLNIDSYTNSIRYQFHTKRHMEEYFDSINFEFTSSADNVDVYGTVSKITLKIRESKGFWIQIGLALTLFSVLSVYMGADLSSIRPITIGSVFCELWAKCLAGLFQAGVLFWLFRLVGKKFL